MQQRSNMQHISIAVGDPKKCAETLAELTDGEAALFSPLEKSFVSMWGGWEGQFIEFYPAGTVLLNTPEGCEFGHDKARGSSHGVHIAIEVEKSLVEIQKIAESHQCPHRGRPEGGGPVYEVWLDDGKLLIELVSDEIRKTIK